MERDVESSPNAPMVKLIRNSLFRYKWILLAIFCGILGLLSLIEGVSVKRPYQVAVEFGIGRVPVLRYQEPDAEVDPKIDPKLNPEFLKARPKQFFVMTQDLETPLLTIRRLKETATGPLAKALSLDFYLKRNEERLGSYSLYSGTFNPVEIAKDLEMIADAIVKDHRRQYDEAVETFDRYFQMIETHMKETRALKEKVQKRVLAGDRVDGGLFDSYHSILSHSHILELEFAAVDTKRRNLSPARTFVVTPPTVPDQGKEIPPLLLTILRLATSLVLAAIACLFLESILAIRNSRIFSKSRPRHESQ